MPPIFVHTETYLSLFPFSEPIKPFFFRHCDYPTNHNNLKMKQVLTLFMLTTTLASAQVNITNLYQPIARQDSLMFTVVYKCQPEKVKAFFTKDLEFYHDKGGLTTSLEAF